MIHHSDRGSQYFSIRYTEKLADNGFTASVSSVGDSYDNALAETIHGLYKAEVIHKQAWKNWEEVEHATLIWVDWLTIKGYCNLSAISRLLNTKTIIIDKPSRLRQHDSD